MSWRETRWPNNSIKGLIMPFLMSLKSNNFFFIKPTVPFIFLVLVKIEGGLMRLNTLTSIETRLPNLRFPLDSWHWNKFEYGFRSWFRVRLPPEVPRFSSLFWPTGTRNQDSRSLLNSFRCYKSNDALRIPGSLLDP